MKITKKRPTRVPAELITIGSELIRGDCIDENSSYLSRELTKLGFTCRQFTVLPDFPLTFLVKTLRTTLRRTPVVILSGGLGPTEDDITRQAIAKALKKRLLLSPLLLKEIRRSFRKRRLLMPGINERQAYLPQGAKAIPNPIGSAPGILVESGRNVLISLPGVPKELQGMFEKKVRPYLKQRFPHLVSPPSILLRTTGLAESRVNELLEDLIQAEKNVTFGFYAYPGVVDVKLALDPAASQAKNILHRVEKAVRQRLRPFLFGEGKETLEKVVFDLLEKRRRTVSVAESCTGGALSSNLTTFPGSSRYFKMGVVAYSNAAKTSLVGVPPELLREHGAVSDPVARKLAQGARTRGQTDYGLGVTGILGPTGGTKAKPVGLVFIALATSQKVISHQFYFVGERGMIRIRVVKAALELLRRELLSG